MKSKLCIFLEKRAADRALIFRMDKLRRSRGLKWLDSRALFGLDASTIRKVRNGERRFSPTLIARVHALEKYPATPLYPVVVQPKMDPKTRVVVGAVRILRGLISR
jgi:hypothetical protein